jgi:hypothetical protein
MGVKSAAPLAWGFLCAVLAAAASTPLAAQMARNGAYLELGGSAIVPSINYERRFSEGWYGRVGFSRIVGESENDKDVTYVFPFTASRVNRPAANHHFELGGGVTLITGDRQDLFDYGDDDDERFSNLVLTGIAGYRYQKPGSGFQFRAVVTPVLVDGALYPWLGLSFGYAW